MGSKNPNQPTHCSAPLIYICRRAPASRVWCFNICRTFTQNFLHEKSFVVLLCSAHCRWMRLVRSPIDYPQCFHAGHSCQLVLPNIANPLPFADFPFRLFPFSIQVGIKAGSGLGIVVTAPSAVIVCYHPRLFLAYCEICSHRLSTYIIYPFISLFCGASFDHRVTGYVIVIRS